MRVQFVSALQIIDAGHLSHGMRSEQNDNLFVCCAQLLQLRQRRGGGRLGNYLVIGGVTLEQFALDQLQIFALIVDSNEDRFSHDALLVLYKPSAPICWDNDERIHRRWVE